MATSCEHSSNNPNVSSLQKIFNAAWQHFIVNDNPPASDEGLCKYLMYDGRKCAIGLSIPDGHPALNFSGGFSGLVFDFQDLFPDLVNEDGDYLDEFQERLHDNLQRGGQWIYSQKQRKQKYINVTRQYGLTIPEQSS